MSWGKPRQTTHEGNKRAYEHLCIEWERSIGLPDGSKNLEHPLPEA